MAEPRKLISLRVSEDEHRLLLAAATRRGLPLTTWLRMVAMDAAAVQPARPKPATSRA